VSDPADPSGSKRVRVRLEIRGRVQGVWYRGSAQVEARRLGVVGWARNRSDGSVEILAEGASSSIRQLVDWCRRGPPAARVRDVARSDEAPCDDLRDFLVR